MQFGCLLQNDMKSVNLAAKYCSSMFKLYTNYGMTHHRDKTHPKIIVNHRPLEKCAVV